jgi:ParB family chromosome partitioning protein
MAETNVESNFQTIPVDQIAPAPHQARKVFDEKALKGLAESMRQEGLLQPITVRLIPEARRGGQLSALSTGSDANRSDGQGAQLCAPTYELISGERRLRAAKMLGWPAIDAKIIQTVSEGEAAAKGLIENLQREDLNPIEEARGFEDLNQLDPVYWTQEQIGKITGKGQTYVSESLRLLKLPAGIQDSIARAILTCSHGELLLRLPTPKQQESVAKMMEDGSWNVRKSEKYVNQVLNKIPKQKPAGQKGGYDPFSDLWPQLLSNRAIDAMGGWLVSYKNEHWNFSLSSKAAQTKEDLAKWFKQMNEAISKDQ